MFISHETESLHRASPKADEKLSIGALLELDKVSCHQELLLHKPAPSLCQNVALAGAPVRIPANTLRNSALLESLHKQGARELLFSNLKRQCLLFSSSKDRVWLWLSDSGSKGKNFSA